MADPIPTWTPYYSLRGPRKVKGIAIVYRCADIGLELKSALGAEWDREDLCKELCEALNKAFRARHHKTGSSE